MFFEAQEQWIIMPSTNQDAQQENVVIVKYSESQCSQRTLNVAKFLLETKF